MYGNNSDTFVLRFDAVPHAERPEGGDTTWNLILHRNGTFYRKHNKHFPLQFD